MHSVTRKALLFAFTAAVISSCSDSSGLPGIGAPTAVLVVSGQDQSGVVGKQLASPIEVRVVDDAGRGVPGQIVNFVVTKGGGSVFAGSAITNVDGIAKEL